MKGGLVNRTEQRADHVLVTGSAPDMATFERVREKAKSETLYRAQLDVTTLRAGFRAFAESPLARNALPTQELKRVDVDGVPGYWLSAADSSRNYRMLYLHGGAYVCGSSRAAIGVASSFCSALGCPVLAIDYRQSPEHPFPAAYDDVLRACVWLAKHGDTPFFIGGDSAGGGLAVAAALGCAPLRIKPAGVISISGVLDLSISSPTWHSNAATDLVSSQAAEFFYNLYLNGADARDPRASPVFADLRVLPPTMLMAGGGECLLGDSQMLADAAREQGCDVHFEIYAAMPHNFVKFANPVADLAFERVGQWRRMRFTSLK